MSGTADQLSSTDELVASLKHLEEYVEEEKYQEAIEVCETLEKGDCKDLLYASIYEIHAKCLLQLENFQQVLDLYQKVITPPRNRGGGNKNKNNNNNIVQKVTPRLKPLVSYAWYRLNDYVEALQQLPSSDNNGSDGNEVSSDLLAQHIRAQVSYHQSKTTDALDVYKSLLQDENPESKHEQMELLTNAMAALNANATPYVRPNPNILDDEWWLDATKSFLQESTTNDYDLEYNLGTYQLITGGLSTMHLEHAEQSCNAVLKDEDPKDVNKELAPIQTNLIWYYQWNGLLDVTDYGQLTTLPPAVHLVRQHNQALLSNGKKKLPTLDAKWTALQTRIWLYNQAVIQLNDGDWEQCQTSCQTLLKSLQPMTKSQQKKQKQQNQNDNVVSKSMPTVADQDDKAWWEARVDVILAHGTANKENKDKAIQILKDRQEKIKALGSSSDMTDLAMAHVQLHLAELQSPNASPEDKIKVLKSLPSSVQSKQGVLATLSSLYLSIGKEDDALKLLQQSSDNQDMVAAMLSDQGKFDEAIELYKQAASKSNDPDIQARYVQALAKGGNLQKAYELWSSLALSVDVDDNLDPEVLESKELPRVKKSDAATTATSSLLPVDDSQGKTKKSKEAILRRRQRKREAYLAELERKGQYNPDRPTNPNPERWIPKYERSGRRGGGRKGRGPHKGAQGGANERDALKLDAAARRRGEDGGYTAGPSTANMKVSGGGGGGGRKGGRRR